MCNNPRYKSLIYRRVSKRSRLRENISSDQSHAIEYLEDSFQNTMDYEFLERLVKISETYSEPFVHKVIVRWKRLVDRDIEELHNIIEAIPFHKRLSFLTKFRLPMVERQILRLFVQRYPQYSWLPNSIHVTASDLRRQDKTVARWYMKRKSYSVDIDPIILIKSLNNTFRNIGLVYDSRVLTLDEFKFKMNKQSSSCYPHYERKLSPKAQLTMENFVQKVFSSENKELLALVFGELVTVFHRFSPSVKSLKKTVTTKIRLVFGYSFQILALQEMLHGDFIDKFLNRKPFVEGLTRPQISERVLDMRRSAIRNKNLICVSDIEGIDYRLPSLSIYLAHAVMIESNRLSGCTVDDTLLSEIEEILALYEVRTPIVGSWGHTIIANGGTKSGTRFNTFTNSLMMQIGLNYHYIRMDYPNEGLDLVREGKSDDLDFEMDTNDSIQNFERTMSLIHMVVHPDKTHLRDPVCDKIDLLGFDWDWLGNPTKSLDWVASKCIYPESFIDSSFDDRLIIRLVSILAQIHNGLEPLFHLLSHLSSDVRKAFTSCEDIQLSFNKTRDGPREWITLPITTILRVGWRMF